MQSILLIEDNTNFLDNLVEFLEMEGYHIFSTNDGDKGIELAKQYLPNLIICDNPKPGIDGQEVLLSLINSISTSQIPFIFSTTLAEKRNRLECLELGADDYIVKPYHLDNLLDMIKACIRAGSKRQSSIF